MHAMIYTFPYRPIDISWASVSAFLGPISKNSAAEVDCSVTGQGNAHLVYPTGVSVHPLKWRRKRRGKTFSENQRFLSALPKLPPSSKTCFLFRKMSSLKYRSAKLWRVGWWGVSQYWEHSIDLTEHTRPVLGCKKPPALFWLDGTRTDLKRAAMLGAGLSARREQGGCFVRGELPSLYPTFQNKICLGKWP